MAKKQETIIGIDLGTTNSAVSVVQGNQPIIIQNSEGRRTTPSVIGFKEGERKIGDPAKRQSVTNSENTIYSIKRFIGKEYSAVKDKTNDVPFKVKKGDQDNVLVHVDGKDYTPQELSAMVLQKMKKTAEEYLGYDVSKAVITVPAYFNDAERQATIEAGKIAGLEVERIINEPTAASLAYGIEKKNEESKILVFDCGGGTHDVSILDVGDGVYEVKSTDGDTNLGGDDFDNALIKWIVDEFKNENSNFDVSKDVMAMQRIREAAEKAKIELSSSNETDINLPYITSIDNNPVHFSKKITRSKFEQLISNLVDRTIDYVKSALDKAKMSVDEVDEVILVGGSTRIPAVQNKVEEYLNKKANKSVNPDEVVAMGAAIQGGVLSGNVDDVLLLDVTPLSLGIETMGNVMTKLIDANTTIPTQKTETFSTAADNQSSVEIHVLQGERPMAKDNHSLGRFHLDEIPPAPRGVPQIEVSLDIDSNGVLNVSAKDKGTGKENKIRIEGGTKLSDEEIERMKKEAEENAEEDKKQKEKVDKINQADSLVFQTEKQVKEFGDKVSDEDKNSLDEAKEELKKEVDQIRSNDDHEIGNLDEKIEKLNNLWNSVSQKIYSQQEAQEKAKEEVQKETQKEAQKNSTNENQNNTNDEDQVEDVDFEEVK